MLVNEMEVFELIKTCIFGFVILPCTNSIVLDTIYGFKNLPFKVYILSVMFY